MVTPRTRWSNSHCGGQFCVGWSPPKQRRTGDQFGILKSFATGRRRFNVTTSTWRATRVELHRFHRRNVPEEDVRCLSCTCSEWIASSININQNVYDRRPNKRTENQQQMFSLREVGGPIPRWISIFHLLLLNYVHWCRLEWFIEAFHHCSLR